MSQVNIFTDGSKTAHHVGAGFTIRRGNNTMVENSYKLPNDCTVFQAEIYAIKMAMQSFNDHILHSDAYIKVFSDSRAAIQALNSNFFSSQLVKDTVTHLNIIGSKVNRLEISWIKAHVGHEGN